jgi:pimeloyl-ACP methyl ester carboxylesterase
MAAAAPLPILLLHGFPQDARCWNEVAPALRDAGHEVIAPDLRGASANNRPAARSAYRLPALVEDVLRIADEHRAADRFHLVGHDWGGVLGWAVAAAHPERVASWTSVSTPHPAAMARSLTNSSQGVRSSYVGLFKVPVLAEASLRFTLQPVLRASGCPKAYAAHYAEINRDRSRLTGALNWYRAAAPRDLRAVGPSAVPTSFVWGKRDFALGRAAAEATAGHVTGPYRFEEVDGGHWLPETMGPELARRILDHVGNAARTSS